MVACGLQNHDFRKLLCLLNVGEGFGLNEALPLPLFLCFHADDARPGKLTLLFFFLQNLTTPPPPDLCFLILIPRIMNKLGVFNYDLRKIDE